MNNILGKKLGGKEKSIVEALAGPKGKELLKKRQERIDQEKIGEALDNMGNEDSICSVSASNMFNPYRAHHIKNGYLETIIPQEMIPNRDTINNKNDQGDIYFRNGNFDIVKRDVFFRNDNNLPLQWLGKKIKPYIQDMTWELDEPWQESYIHETSRYK